MQNDSTTLDRIHKLLRLADKSRGATEHEAQTALTKAQELMVKHNIDSARICIEKGEKFEVEAGEGQIQLPKNLNPCDMPILTILHNYFNVKCVVTRGGESFCTLIGSAEDVDFATFAFRYLRATFLRCWKEFKADRPWASANAYYKGLRYGLSKALQAAKDKASEGFSGYALIISAKTEAIQKYQDDHFGKLKKIGTPCIKDSESYYAGVEKGETLKVNRPLPA